MSDSSSPVLEIQGVTKRYGRVPALGDVSFDVRRGEIVGLVGANGAGKTTMIRIALGLLRPDAGTVRIDGSAFPFPRAFRSLGYAGADVEHYTHVSAGRLFRLISDLRGDGSLAAALSLAERLSLDVGTTIRRLSRGNRQKVSIVLGLLSGPGLLILDEPTTALDPATQRTVLDLLMEARRRGAAVLVSSHQLHDIEKACDRVCLIDSGRLREVVSISEIRRRSRSTVTVTLERALPEAVTLMAGVTATATAPRTWELVAADVGSVLALLLPAGILDIEIRKASLERYFRERLVT
jgi:ABC-2 type transport system ATP-binding protein